MIEDFRNELRRGRSVVFVGAGVSLAATGNSRAGWAGLLRSGRDYAVERGVMDSDSAQLCDEALEAGTVDDLLDAATEIVHSLKSSTPQSFEAWLDHDIGNLHVSDSELLEAILDLKLPILTTNYDDLLERAGNREHVTWLQPAHLQKVLAAKSDAIAHFHGYYTEPNSIILTRDQYELLLQNENVTALRNSVAALNNIVYIGFGAGMDDPAFRSLNSWIMSVMGAQLIKHYVLVREADVPEDTAKTPHIEYVPYGSEFSDLPRFLRQLETPEMLVRASTAIDVFAAVENEIRRTSIIGSHHPRLDSAKMHELVVDPVLLTIPHEQYVMSGREGNDSRSAPCDNRAELEHERLLLVADANAGLTTALRWFTTSHHLADVALNPVYVNYRVLGSGQRPLDNEVRRVLRQSDFPIGSKAALPPISLAIDGMRPTDARLLSRVLAELADPAYVRVVIGCRTEVEPEVQAALIDSDARFQVRYLGRLREADVRQLVSLVDSTRVDALTSVAIQVARRAHLPSTPFTFSMIVSALIRGESLLGTTSQTALLDAYVSALMGWGEQSEDSRGGLDATNRAHLISQLAQLFVNERRASLPQETVVAELGRLFNALEWPDSPIDTLKDLEFRHLLRIRGNDVAFAQSSYLHLFAAKRAERSSAFRDSLLEDPLYFAPIIAHYAALRRDDTGLLTQLSEMLTPYSVETSFDRGVFAVDPPDEARRQLPNEGERSTDSLLERLDKDFDTVAEASAAPTDEDRLDGRYDGDIEPFPLDPVEDGLPAMFATLTLVSSVLRDTEIIEDATLRRQVLSDLLMSWANLVRELELLPEIDVVVEEIVRSLEIDLSAQTRRTTALLRDLRDGLVLASVYSALSSALRSKKLSVSLGACLDDPNFVRNVGRTVLGVLLTLDISEPGWSKRFLQVEEQYGDVRAVDRVLRSIAMQALVRQSLTKTEEQDLIEFVVRRSLAEFGEERVDRAAIRTSVEKKLIGLRMELTPAGMLPPGRTIIDVN